MGLIKKCFVEVFFAPLTFFGSLWFIVYCFVSWRTSIIFGMVCGAWYLIYLLYVLHLISRERTPETDPILEVSIP